MLPGSHGPGGSPHDAPSAKTRRVPVTVHVVAPPPAPPEPVEPVDDPLVVDVVAAVDAPLVTVDEQPPASDAAMRRVNPNAA
jgi:hypothetical protein